MTEAQELLNEIYDSKLLDREAVIERWLARVRGTADTERLDWLDSVNTKTNARNNTCYGWKFDINHNRAALTDHNLPALHVRAAIDAVRAQVKTDCERCKICGGSGVVSYIQSAGGFSEPSPCYKCNGTGRIVA